MIVYMDRLFRFAPRWSKVDYQSYFSKVGGNGASIGTHYTVAIAV